MSQEFRCHQEDLYVLCGVFDVICEDSYVGFFILFVLSCVGLFRSYVGLCMSESS